MKTSHQHTESSSDSSLDSQDKKRIKKLKKKLKKEQKKKEKKIQKQLKAARKKIKKYIRRNSSESSSDQSKYGTTDIPIELMETSRAMAPMTKEEWDQKQSVIRRVLDPETGRHRLIKGDGEVLEEIVSRERHREINRQATRADGESFQAQTTLRLKK